MSKLREQVLEFHRAFEQKIGEKPEYPDPQTLELRVNLINEEGMELCEALGAEWDKDRTKITEQTRKSDLVEVADALGDLMYVIEGAFISMGIDSEAVLDEIHRSNMSKVGGVKREDGKWLKPDSYSPVDLLTVLKGQGYEPPAEVVEKYK